MAPSKRSFKRNLIRLLWGTKKTPSQSKHGKKRSFIEWIRIILGDVLATISGELEDFPERVKIICGNRAHWRCQCKQGENFSDMSYTQIRALLRSFKKGKYPKETRRCTHRYSKGYILNFHHIEPRLEVHEGLHQSGFGQSFIRFWNIVCEKPIRNYKKARRKGKRWYARIWVTLIYKLLYEFPIKKWVSFVTILGNIYMNRAGNAIYLCQACHMKLHLRLDELGISKKGGRLLRDLYRRQRGLRKTERREREKSKQEHKQREEWERTQRLSRSRS